MEIGLTLEITNRNTVWYMKLDIFSECRS